MSTGDSPPPPGDPVEFDGAEAPPSPIRLIVQFFVVPAGIVAAAVGVFLLFGAITIERENPKQLLARIQSSADETRRWQAAFQLSKAIGRVTDPAERDELVAGIAPLLPNIEGRDDDDAKLFRYLVLVLGDLRRPGAVTPLLAELERRSDTESKVYVLWALASIGDKSAAPAVVPLAESPDAALRKTALWTLARVGGPEHAPLIAAHLDDPVIDVRWNAALALSTQGDRRALPVLRSMTDRAALAATPDLRPDQLEEAMLAAIPALARLDDRESIAVLTTISTGDPSLKVRDAAIKAMAAMGKS